MSKTFLSSTLLVFILLFQACSSNKKSEEVEDANAMVASNEYILTELNKTQYTVKKESNGFSVNGTQGKVIILDVFATWCPPCQAEASHLSSLQEKYKNDLLVLGISVEEGIEGSKLQAFRDEFNAQYAIVNSSENRRLIDAVASQLNVGRNFGIPLMALYKDGKFINFYQGATEEEFIESDIKRALGK